MKHSNFIIGSMVLAFFTLGIALGAKKFVYEYKLYRAGDNFTSEFGCNLASGELADLAAKALEAMGVAHRPLINVYETAEISCAATWHMWLNCTPSLGPCEFVVFHEAAHIACGHFEQRIIRDVYNDEARVQEQEADLLACKTLHELAMDEVIVKRIKEIKHALDAHYTQTDLDDHPSLEEMYEYMTEFCKNNGIL